MVDADEAPRCSSARQQIKRLFVGDETRPHQRFFPVDKLRSFLTRPKVTWLLECRCSICKKDHATFKRARQPTEFIGSIMGLENDEHAQREPAKTALALFALLIFIEHPLLIIGFVMRRCSDHTLETRTPAQFSVHNLREGHCQEFAARVSEDDFRQFAADFAEALPKFAVPRMDSGVYSVYGPDTILPFINERKIGVRDEDGVVRQEGAHGKVYAFDVYEEYRKFPHAKEHTQFARKELDSNSELAFHLENNNLEHASTLKNPHIVKMIKAYKLGDTFNLIFPLAKTNLDHLLRDPALDTSNSIQVPMESHPAWNQVLGIAKGVREIGGPNGTEDISEPSDEQKFHGMHFDLKPANILVDDQGTWIISDFGESTFRETSRSTSRVENGGGTDAYAPPEIDNLEARFSRRYDVWSLGCIMLEVTAFVILGYDGLCGDKGLDRVRYTTSDWNSRKDSDHRFFSQESPNGKFIVKKEITRFMKSLAASESLRGHQKSQVFVGSILELITKMLEPEAEFRIDIEDVVRRLRSAIDTARGNAHLLGQMVPGRGERLIGEPALNDMRLWHFRQDDWHDASIRIFEDEYSNLRTCTALQNNTEPSENHIIRNTTILIPRYAFHDNSHKLPPGPAIYFSHNSPEGPQKYRGLILSFHGFKDALFIQETLAGQKVEASFPLESIKYQEYISLISSIKSRVFHGKYDKEGDYKDLGTATVQLWTEIIKQGQVNDRKNSIVSTKGESSRGVRRQPHQQPGYQRVPMRRMAIFLHNLRKIIVVAMDRNWDVDNKFQEGEQPKFLHFGPRNRARDPSFVATTLLPLLPGDPNSFAGVPLSPVVLHDIEYHNSFECNSIGLTFRSEETKKTFLEMYQEVWKKWYKEAKIAERQPGYTPVPSRAHNKKQPTQSASNSTSRSPSCNLARALLGSASNTSGSTTKEQVVGRVPNRGGGRGGFRPLKKREAAL